MKYIVMMFGDQASMMETKSMEWVKEMIVFMEQVGADLEASGELVASVGLADPSQAKVVDIKDGVPVATDGPFAESKELIAGFWILEVKSKEEAIEWVKRCPNPMPDEDAVIEIRPVFEAEDFGKVLTPELRAQEDRLRAQVERQQGKR